MLNSVAKKLFAVGLAGSVVVMALAPLAAFAQVHAAGTNVLESNGTVAMVGTDGQLHPYTSAGAFLSYGFNSFSSVTTATSQDLALPTGSFIPPQDGSIICSDRGADQGTCYFISGGQKFGFTSAAVFTGLGFSFANAKTGDVSWMTMSSTLLNSSTMQHLPGTLINQNGTVYLVGTNGLLGIPDLNTFNSWGYSFNNVVPANSADSSLTQTGVMALRQAGQLSPTNTTTTCTSNCGTSTTPVVNGTVTASLASDNPAASTLVSTVAAVSGQPQAPGETGADLAHFTFSGTGTVTQVVVNRIGVSSDSSINNVYLYMGNNRITDAGSFSNGAVTFANSNGLFTVNGSAEVSVRVDVAGGISGQTIGAQLASFTVANGSPMATSISGNLFTVAQISNLATVTVASSTVISSSGSSYGVNTGTINAGTTNAVLWSAPINVSQRTVLLKYIAFKQIGSISQSAIQNLKLMIDGTQYGSTASITSNGSNSNVVIFDLTGSPVSLTTGSHTLALNGDIVTGTSYTYNFTLQTATDVVFYDTNYQVNVPFVNSATNQQVIQLSPGTTTISAGSVAVQLDPTFSNTQFVKNASQVDLGQWTMKAYGEAVKVQSLNVVLNYFLANGSTYVTPSSTDGFNNLSLFVNGGQVGSSQSAIDPTVGGTPAGSAPTYTFGSTNLFTIPAGTTVTVEVKGDSVLSSIDAVAVVRADLATPVNSLQGVTSFALTGGSTYTGVSLTDSGSTGTLNSNTGYSVPTFSPNMSNQHIGSYIVQAGSADGVRVTSLTVGLNTVGLSVNNFANLYIVTPNGQTTPVQPSASNNFSVNFSVPVNQTATVDVYADISNATGTASTTMFGTGQGVTSNQAVSLATAGSPAVGQTITVSTGSLGTPTLLTSASPVAQLVAAGSTNQAIATFFATSTSGTTITELGFSASGTGATLAQDAISSVTVGGVTQPMTGTTSLVTGLNIVVPSGFNGVNIPVTVNYTPFGATPNSNKTVQLILSHVKTVSGGQTTTINAPVYLSTGTMTPVYSPTMLVVGTVPTVALAAPNATLTGGGANQLIANVTVTPGSTGNMILTQLPVTIGTSGTVSLATSSLTVEVGSSVVPTTLSGGPNGSTLIIFTGGYTISSNPVSPVTFGIYGTVTGSVGSAGTSAISTSVQPSTQFLWTDVAGNATGVTGQYIVNYPTGAVSYHN
jgi:hypothetical protein